MHAASSDVYALRYSLANTLPTRDLDKFFVKGRDNPGESTRDPEITELAELVPIAINLRDTVKVLENSVEILQDENADMRTRLDALDARPAVAASAPEHQWTQNTSAQPNNAQAARPPPVLPIADDLVPPARAPSVSSRYSFKSSDSSPDSSSSESEDYIPVSRRKASRVKKSRAKHTRPASRTTWRFVFGIKNPVYDIRQSAFYV